MFLFFWFLSRQDSFFVRMPMHKLMNEGKASPDNFLF